MLTLDGSIGEGGGQILRSALGLALVTGQPFRLEHIRARRKQPGLQAQHLAAVRAAATVGQAEVEGAELHSQQLLFRPREVTAGEYAFATGTAGSATLVLQTILPALVTANKASALVLEGGTHNPMAPPFEFIAKVFLPLLNQMGPTIRAKLDAHGFYPAGGGKMRVTIEPATKLQRLDVLERGNVVGCRCTALIANLPRHVAERELKVLKRELSLDQSDLQIQEIKSPGPGNALLVEVESTKVTEVFVAFGEAGVKAEVVAGRLAKETREYLEANVPVASHLADQLLLPIALAGAGAFVTFPLSPHSLTNIEVIKTFLSVDIKVFPASEQSVSVEVSRS